MAMASSLPDDFEKIDINATDDVRGGVPCATCGKEGASKKCKKRHGGCAQKMFCGSACETKGHEKERVKEGHDQAEAEGDEVDFAASVDAAIAKENKKRERRERKKAYEKLVSTKQEQDCWTKAIQKKII